MMVCCTAPLSTFHRELRFVAVPLRPGTVRMMRAAFRPVSFLEVTRGLYVAAAIALAFSALRASFSFWPELPMISWNQDDILDVIEAHNFIFNAPSLGGIWSWGLENRYLGSAYIALAALGGATFAAFAGLPWFHLGVWAGPVLFSQALLAYAAYRLGRGFNPLAGWGFYAAVVYLVQAANGTLLFNHASSYGIIPPGVLALGAFMALYSARRSDAAPAVLTAGLLFQAHPTMAILGASVAVIVAIDRIRELLAARRSRVAPRPARLLTIAYLLGFAPVLARFLFEGTSMLRFASSPISLEQRLNGGLRYMNDAVFRHEALAQPRLLGAAIGVTLTVAGCSLLLTSATRRFGVFFTALHIGLLAQAFVLSREYPISRHSYVWYPAVFEVIRVFALPFLVLCALVVLTRRFTLRTGRGTTALLRVAAVPTAFGVLAYAVVTAFGALPLAQDRYESTVQPGISEQYQILAEKLPDTPMVLFTGPSIEIPAAMPVYAAALTSRKPICVHVSAIPAPARVENGLDYLICTEQQLASAQRYILVQDAREIVDTTKWRLLYDNYRGIPTSISMYEDIGGHSLEELQSWPTPSR